MAASAEQQLASEEKGCVVGNSTEAAPTESMSTAIKMVEASLAEFDCPFEPNEFRIVRHFRTEQFTRAFKPGGFDKFLWLHYVKDSVCVLCISCVIAVEKKIVKTVPDLTALLLRVDLQAGAKPPKYS